MLFIDVIHDVGKYDDMKYFEVNEGFILSVLDEEKIISNTKRFNKTEEIEETQLIIENLTRIGWWMCYLLTTTN